MDDFEIPLKPLPQRISMASATKALLVAGFIDHYRPAKSRAFPASRPKSLLLVVSSDSLHNKFLLKKFCCNKKPSIFVAVKKFKKKLS